MKSFEAILALARTGIRNNPKMSGRETTEVTQRYLDGLINEVAEIKEEVHANNSVYLEDELSDVAWNYAALLVACDKRGGIENANEVLAHAHEKYTERLPAYFEGSQELWEQIKKEQKDELKRRHQERHD